MKLINSEYYKILISKNKSEQLCNELLAHLNEYLVKDRNLEIQKIYDDLIMITGRQKSINQEQLLNIINFEDATIEKAKIDKSLLKLINQLPSYYFDFMNGGEIKETSQNDIRKNIDEFHKNSKFEYDAFFSYSSDDYEGAKKICEELRGYGLNIFLSGEALKSTIGSSFFEKIEKALESSQHFILLSSVKSMNSEWVKTEYETFYNEFFIPSKGERKFLITKGESYSQDSVPTLLRRLQIADSPKEIIDTILLDRKSDSSEANKDEIEIDTQKVSTPDIVKEDKSILEESEVAKDIVEEKVIKQSKTVDKKVEEEKVANKDEALRAELRANFTKANEKLNLKIDRKKSKSSAKQSDPSIVEVFMNFKYAKFFVSGVVLIFILFFGIRYLSDLFGNNPNDKKKNSVIATEVKAVNVNIEAVAKLGANWIGGKITADLFKAQNKIDLSVANCSNNCDCSIQGFGLTRLPQRSDAEEVINRGAAFTRNTKSLISKARPGDFYIFSAIKYTCNGKKYTANVLTFRIMNADKMLVMSEDEDAIVTFGNLKKGKGESIKNGTFKSLVGLEAREQNCTSECNCEIYQFSFVRMAPRADGVTIVVSGNKLNVSAKRLQAKAKPGDKYLIKDIKGSCNNKAQYFPGLYFRIS